MAQFLEQYYTPSDLTLFQQTYNLPVQAPVKVVGHNDASSPGVEAELDIEYIMGVATNVPTWFVYTAGRHASQEPFLEWIQFINDHNSRTSVQCRTTHTTRARTHGLRCRLLTWHVAGCAAAPLVNSVSYGDVESSITLAYVQRVDLEFQKVGLTGTRHATSCHVTFPPLSPTTRLNRTTRTHDTHDTHDTREEYVYESRL